MSLRIGMVFADLPQEGMKPGGVSVVVHELSNALVRAKNFVRIYSYSPKPKDALYEVVNLNPFINLKLSRRIFLPFQLALLDYQDLDVLHLHGEDWAYFNRNIPTIRTFHGCSLNEAKFADNLKSKLIFAIYHYLELLAQKLANISVGIGDDTVNLLGVKEIIPNGYAKDLYYPEQKAAKPTAIVVGTLQGRKQSLLAIELLLKIKKEIPELVIHAVVDRPYDHPDVNNWIGISREDLAKLTRDSWIGVSTTLYEGFGIYYLEWMASGTIPITFENIGVKSLVTDSQAGSVVKDISAMYETTLSILKNSSIRNTYSHNAIAASKSLSWDGIAQKYLKFYAELL
jgi:phosphatidyl-myo-inositol alpha-mannosyltransferase